MNTKQSLLIMLLALCMSCQNESSIGEIHDELSISTLTGKWKVVSFDDYKKDTQIKKNAGNTGGAFHFSRDIVINFKDDSLNGVLEGRTMTNSVSGKYSITALRKINISQIVGTLVYEPEWGELFWNSIGYAEEFRINKNQLRIFYSSKKKSITFERTY